MKEESLLTEELYASGLGYLKRQGECSPRDIQDFYWDNRRSKGQAVFLACKFILEGVRKEEIEITNNGKLNLLKPKECSRCGGHKQSYDVGSVISGIFKTFKLITCPRCNGTGVEPNEKV